MTDSGPRIVNVAQAEAWNGGQGSGWLQREEQHAVALRAHHERLLAAAAIAPGEHVLDVGCGTGPTTLAVARAAGARGSAVGLDISAPLLARARERAEAEGCSDVEFVQADAQVESLATGRFDAVISQFGVMFFDDPVAAFGNFALAARPGGRLAFVCWRGLAENPWLVLIRDAVANGRVLPPPPENSAGMLGLADRDRVTSVLAAAGWQDVAVEPVDLPYVMGNLDDACAGAASVSMVRQALDPLDDDGRAAALAALREALAVHDGPGGIVLQSGVWIVTARIPEAGR
jgi:SAM-dependent methyltransferase